jgi:uncharacterized membrane protein
MMAALIKDPVLLLAYVTGVVGLVRLPRAEFHLLLSSLGAHQDPRQRAAHPQFVLSGVIVIALHALLAAIRVLRTPLPFCAAASQALLGGSSSAPIVGAMYHPAMAPGGALLAVLGNRTGTHAGRRGAPAPAGLAA